MGKLSATSIKRLKGVKPELVKVVERAIEISKVDFMVVQGLRTLAEQKKLVATGKSQTMNSKHLTGDAVDLAVVENGQVTWNLSDYDDIADAMKKAAKELGVKIRWGAAWNIPDIREWDGTMQEALDFYVAERRKAKKVPFIDGPHFELN